MMRLQSGVLARRRCNRRATGFTLIELVTVIVLLGILATFVVARFIDLQREAEEAAARSIVGAINAANALNVSACRIDADDCTDIDRADEDNDDGQCIDEASKILSQPVEVPGSYAAETRVPSAACGDLPFRLNEVVDGSVTGDQVPANAEQSCVLRPVDGC